MKARAIAAVAILLLVTVFVKPVRAQGMIEMSRCDSTRVGGVLYPRITFRIHNIAPAQKIACHLLLVPQNAGAPTDSCHAISALGPPGWVTNIRSFDGAPIWDTETTGEFCVFPGNTLDGFQVVLSRTDCCFDAYFSNAIVEPFAHEVVCLHCDLPVPARNVSWGRLKVHYE